MKDVLETARCRLREVVERGGVFKVRPGREFDFTCTAERRRSRQAIITAAG